MSNTLTSPPRDVHDRARQAQLANIRHELRTPINAIIGYSEMLLEDMADQGLDDYRPDLQKVHTAGHELLKSVNNLLSPTRGNEAELASADLGATLRHTLLTPITTILGYLELLLEELADGGRSDLTADLQKMHTAAERFLAFINDIVTFPQQAAGEVATGQSASDTAALAEDVVRTIRSLKEDDGWSQPVEGGSLLVVDDNEVNRDVLSRHLARQGHRVATAENGRQALQMIAQRPYDVVLLDIMMPEMNGYQVLQTLKADPTLRHIPVIMISALDEIDTVVRCLELGAEDYLPKPFNPVLLRARLGASLEKKRWRDKEQAYLEQLRLEREKSERLLLNVLPAPIAQRLKDGENTIADTFSAVTVLFADVVGFTEFSAQMAPSEIIAILNELFSAFDQLAEQHGVEKIKTIGDGYMVVGGLPMPRPDHAEAVADMALAMRREVARFNASRPYHLNLRIGIHSGPVVAGIIGARKFSYDLWGDTVNTASRMESYSIPGGIQVTPDTYTLLQTRYFFEERGFIQVRSKGTMKTYLLLDTRR